LVSHAHTFSDDTEPYAKSLENLGLSFRAFEIAFREIQIPELASAAARAINQIIRTSALIRLHVPEVTHAIREILSGQIDIVEKIRVLEGYVYLIAQSVDAQHIPDSVSNILGAFANVDIHACDPGMALDMLKVVFTIGKTLHSFAPSKLSSQAWSEGPGRDLASRTRDLITASSQRFSDSFEILEVIAQTLRH
jgi:hypothetical protein